MSSKAGFNLNIENVRKYIAEKNAENLMRVGQLELNKGNFKTAVNNITMALQCLREVQSTEKYVVYLNTLGVIYAESDMPEEAFECYLEGIAMTRVMKNCSYLRALCDINVGSCYQKMGHHEKAIEYFQHAQHELKKPSVKSIERFQMWSMVNYINLKESYGEIGMKEEQCDDKFLVFA